MGADGGKASTVGLTQDMRAGPRATSGERSQARVGTAHPMAPGSGEWPDIRMHARLLRQWQEREGATQGSPPPSQVPPTWPRRPHRETQSSGHHPWSGPGGPSRPQPGRVKAAPGAPRAPGKTGLLGPRRDMPSPCLGDRSPSQRGLLLPREAPPDRPAKAAAARQAPHWPWDRGDWPPAPRGLRGGKPSAPNR